MLLIMDYRFGKASGLCTACGASFADGERYTSALREPFEQPEDAGDDDEREDPGFLRMDLCTACWLTADREPLYSWWQGVKAPTPRKPPTEDQEFLWALLSRARRHADLDAPDGGRDMQAAGHAYVAALGLLRLKHLKLGRHFRSEGHEFLVFTGRESRRHEIVILDPGFSDDQFLLVEEQLEELQSVFLGLTDEPAAEPAPDQTEVANAADSPAAVEPVSGDVDSAPA